MQRMVWSLKRGAGFLIAALLLLAAPGDGQVLGTGTAEAQTIREVVVQGNRRVAAETIRSYLTLATGQSFSAAQANESLRTLFATGLFADVDISMRGNQLIVTVEENPIINVVAFEGNDQLSNDALQQAVESEARGVMTRATVQADVTRILQLYRRSGRFGARVEPQIIDLPENRVNLVFEIDEGERTRVERISFIGNQNFSDRHLRDVIATRERDWLSFIRTTDIYDPERLEADQEALRRHYLKYGYADFRVVSAIAEFDRERNGFFITVTVDEGPRYRVSDVEVDSFVPDIDPEELRRLIRLRPGEIYNAEKVDDTLEDMTFELSNRGYAFAQVRPRGVRNFEDQTIALTFLVEEGPRVYVERINIRGNTRTLDSVIRREFDIVEGDAYNAVMLDRAQRRLEALRYFENIEITREQGSAPDRVVVNVDVEEQPTGEISLGGGYSTRDGWLADVSVTERNLLGRGHIMRVGAQVGQRRRGVDLSFTEPYFLGRRLAAGVDAFYQDIDHTDYTAYRSETIGGGVRLGFNLTDDLQMTTRYQLYQTDILIGGEFIDGCPPVCGVTGTHPITGNPIGPPFGGDTTGDGIADVFAPEASIALKQAAGRSLYSVVGYELVYSTIDSYTRPSEGIHVSFSQDVAGAGGDVRFIRSQAEARHYHEIHPDIITMIKLQGGHITGWGGRDVRVVDSFILGGETIRGFASGGYGPRDLTPGTLHDPLGGTVYGAATAELQFPFPFIPDEFGFSAALFADVGVLFDVGDTGRAGGPFGFLPECVGVTGRTGTPPPGFPGCYVDDSDPRASVGLSLLWQSPFGPLRVDFGYAILKKDYDDTQVFRFGAGTRF